jgi:EAL domain-containing protein (putative c-di-GMP-specific phosphodiesterase class I)
MTARNAHSTVQGIVELARGSSIDTISKYVETEGAAAELRRLGGDYARGCAFGKPAEKSCIGAFRSP